MVASLTRGVFECPDSHRSVGDIEHHEECIRHDEHILSILYRMQSILNYTNP
ncbi:unnamed protein product, partial [marine sediment metagenome]